MRGAECVRSAVENEERKDMVRGSAEGRRGADIGGVAFVYLLYPVEYRDAYNGRVVGSKMYDL